MDLCSVIPNSTCPRLVNGLQACLCLQLVGILIICSLKRPQIKLQHLLGPVYKKRGLPKQAGYHRKRVPLALINFFLRRVYKVARVTRIGVLPYLRARVTLAGGLTFSLVITPGRVTRLIVSTPFEYNRALSCPARL